MKLVAGFILGGACVYLATAFGIAMAARDLAPLPKDQTIMLGLTYPAWVACMGVMQASNPMERRPAKPCIRVDYKPTLGH